MKILFVRPKPSSETIGLQHVMLTEPLELEVLYALKRPEDEGLVLDMVLEKQPFISFVEEFKPDVLCVTGYITNVPAIKGYCREAKNFNKEITTIVGGVHCEVCPSDLENEAVDFRVVRNATTVFTNLLNHIQNGAELPAGVFGKGDSLQNKTLPPFDFSFPYPDRSTTARYRHKYFYIFQDKVALIKTSFGCPWQCSFCFCRSITSGLYARRPLNKIFDELEQIAEKEIYIVDDDFLVDKSRLLEFFAELEKRKIQKHFLIYGRADFIAENQEIMHKFKALGLRTVIVGFESFSDKDLNQYNKKTSASMYKKTMDVLRAEKIDVFATIIVSPNWDKADFKFMVKAVRSLGIYFVNLQPLTPLPETGVNIPQEKIIVSRQEYEKWDLAHVTVQPEKLTVAEFYKEILKAYNAILFRPKAIWKYLITYKPTLFIKMIFGANKVAMQYKKKIETSPQPSPKERENVNIQKLV